MPAFRRSDPPSPEETARHRPLGDLEQAVMEVVWARGTIGSPEVQAMLASRRQLALTTVVTTLDRLHKKGILRRKRVGKGYQYDAVVTRPELEQHIVRGVLHGLMTDYPDALTSLLDEGPQVHPETQTSLSGQLSRSEDDAGSDG
jgi:predicted transcriptional regulator